MKNIIDAVATLVERNDFNLTASRNRNNRANSRGDALEIYAKNLFADTFDIPETERLGKWSEIFSYCGNNANPPDFMYTVGVVSGNKLKHLCIIYGQDYCASDECYARIRKQIKEGSETIPLVSFAPTRELGRVNCVDPLGITYLRIRGMWHIENPWRVFDYVYERNFNAEFNFMCVINSEKWHRLENRDKLIDLQKNYPALKIVDVKIKNPDNPCKLRDAKLIRYEN